MEYIYQMLRHVLDEAPVSYIKWDMNRCMSEVYSEPAVRRNRDGIPPLYSWGYTVCMKS